MLSVTNVALRIQFVTRRMFTVISSCFFTPRVKLAFVLSLWLLCVLPGTTQEGGFVDTRGSYEPKQTEPKGSKEQTPARICDDNCTLAHPLSFQLIKMELGYRSVDWTIRIGNQSNKQIRLPISTMRNETTVESSPGHSVVINMSVVVSLSCASSLGVQRVPVEVNLYGAPDGSRGMSTIDPGQWMTIVGRADTCTDPGKDHDSYSFSASVSSLDSYQVKSKHVEDVSPVYASVNSGSILWEGPGEMTRHLSLPGAGEFMSPFITVAVAH